MSREWRIDEDGDLALWVDGKHARWFNGTEADAVELRPILERGQAEPVADDPLPEGVHRAPDGTLLWHALDHPMPEGYEAFRNGCWGPMGHDPRHDFWYAVRPNGWTLTTANGYQRFVSDSGDIAGEVIKADQT